MVSKIILRMALMLALALSVSAGEANRIVQSGPAPAESGFQEVVIPIEDLFVRDPGNPLDAFDTTIVWDSLEDVTSTWTHEDATIAGASFWHVDAVPTGDPNAPAWWVGDAALTDGLVAPGGYRSHWQEYLTSPSLDLSTATAPVTLGFKARWKMENPGGETPPYNMWDGWNVQVSTDGGTTWTVLTQAEVSLTYTGTCSYAWSDHCYTGCYSAWGGTAYAGAYLVMTGDLSAYSGAGMSDVRFRYAFFSDPAFSAADQGDSSYYGLIIDSIRVSDASSTLLSNDGDATGWAAQSFPLAPLGDTWAYVNNGPTGMTLIPNQDYSWHATHDGVALRDCWLTTPEFMVPDTSPPGVDPNDYQKVVLSYYVWCDMPDVLGSGSYKDLYNIYVSQDDGATWVRFGYDAGQDLSGEDGLPDAGNSLNGWVRRTWVLSEAGDGSQKQMLLNAYDNRPIRVQWRMSTDCDDPGGVGTGLHIDYVSVVGTRAYPDDASARNIVVPFPTTVGLARPWSFEWFNGGSNTLTSATIRWREWIKRPNGTNQVYLPLAQQTGVTLLPNEFITLNRTNWTPDVAGCYVIIDSTALNGEDDVSNDKGQTPTNVPASGDQNLAVEVMPSNVYELGHHVRKLNTGLSNPRLVRFNPTDSGVPATSADTVDITKFQCMFNYDPDILTLPGETARALITFYGAGPDNRTPGAFLYVDTVSIDTTETINNTVLYQWFSLDLTGVYALKRLPGSDLWVEVSALDSAAGAGLPSLLAYVTTPQDTTDTRNYTRRLDIAGEPILASPSRFMMELTVVPTVVADPVTKLTVIRVFGTNNVRLDWPVSLRATSYNVYRSTDPNNPLQTLLGNVATNTYTDVGAVGTDKYFYVVEALPHP